MKPNYIEQLSENAKKLIQAYKRTGDKELLDMAESLLSLLLEEVRCTSADPIFIPFYPDQQRQRPVLPPTVVMYMAAPVDMPWTHTETVTGDSIRITPYAETTEATITYTKPIIDEEEEE